MSTERDTTRIVRSWLEEGVTALPDRVLDAVLDQVPATPQRRSWWPSRRFAQMTRLTQGALAAAVLVVAVLGVVGFGVIPRGAGGPVVASPSPTPTASETPIPTPSSTAFAWPGDDTAVLAPGTYVAGAPYPIRLSVTVPAGWHGWVAGPFYADLWLPNTSGGFYFVLPNTVSVDPCDYPKGFAQVGSTVDDLVAALRNEPGLSVSGVAATSIDGYAGTYLVVKAPASLKSCKLSPEGAVLWHNPLGGISPGLKAGETIRLWILDVEGNRLIVVMQDSAFSSAQRAEAQAVFDSIQLAPAT